MKAGLAGGSTDCACFIECINELFDLKLTKKEMIEIGVTLGADVPQALYNTPVIARGVGEKIDEIKSNARYYIIIIKPDFSCNTKEMYKKLDTGKAKLQKYNTEEMRIALEQGNTIKIAENLYNVFETEVENIEEIKSELTRTGAVGSLMAGSGSAIFGIFENKEKAKEGYKKLSKKYKAFYCMSYRKKE